MSFAGFVFDMIKRDKENRNLRRLRRERLDDRLDKMYKGNLRISHNTTPEEMEKIRKLTAEKERDDLRYNVKAMLLILLACITAASIFILVFIK